LGPRLHIGISQTLLELLPPALAIEESNELGLLTSKSSTMLFLPTPGESVWLASSSASCWTELAEKLGLFLSLLLCLFF